jgi:hypothetical protein
MKLNKILSVITSVIFMGIFTMSPVLAGAPGTEDQEAPPRVFAGTIEISSTQIAFIGSAQKGSGTLEYEGMEHDFKIGGLGVGGIGIQSVNAVGVVYNMEKLSDINGTYSQARLGFAIGKGKSTIGLNNNKNDVYIELKSSNTGIALASGVDGISIKLK